MATDIYSYDMKYSTTDAKRTFFLDSSDLDWIGPCDVFGGFGCGVTRYYARDDLIQAAIRKHGQAGFEKKFEARKKREAKKREREEEAAKAAKELNIAGSNPAENDQNKENKRQKTGDSTKQPSSNQPTLVDAKVAARAEKMRKSLLSSVLRKYKVNEFGSPDKLRVENAGVSMELFAHLINRPQDPTLRTLVKSGAYYTVYMNPKDFFKVKDSEKFVKMLRTTDLQLTLSGDLKVQYKPSNETLTIHGWTEVYW